MRFFLCPYNLITVSGTGKKHQKTCAAFVIFTENKKVLKLAYKNGPLAAYTVRGFFSPSAHLEKYRASPVTSGD